MKAITANSIDSGIVAKRKKLITRIIATREVLLMNLISNILIKDKDIKKSNVENKVKNINEDYGFNLYRALEFGKDHSNKANHNLQMEMICSRLV
jgi:hypothetical protein